MKGNSIDNKAIEEKALNYFRGFIEDSSKISQYLNENDKEPSWDGSLSLYSGNKRNKKCFLGRVPVQVKGIEVDDFKTDKIKFKITKDDLNAYLHEPTFFVVCQIKRGTKERKLFYREFLPDTVKAILRGMGENNTRMTPFHILTDNLNDFEEQLVVFLRNSRKMVSFVDTKPFTMQDAMEKGVKTFSFVAPVSKCDGLNLYKYLSINETRLYANIDKKLDIELPIADGPVRISFCRKEKGDIKVGDRVFYDNYRNEIKDGRINITIGDCFFMNLPIDKTDNRPPEIRFTSSAKNLDDVIRANEFVVALHEYGTLTINNVDFKIKVNEPELIDTIRQNLSMWRDLQGVLKKLNVIKPLDITSITEEQYKLVDILIKTIGRGYSVKLPKQETGLACWEIGNISLLLWCLVGGNEECYFGDFFDGTIKISYKINDKDNIEVSPFSYLQNNGLWEKCDNINYDMIVSKADSATKKHTENFMMANMDVLAMIKASDVLAEGDMLKSRRLLNAAISLCDWLIEEEKDNNLVYFVNKMQIIKRQRMFESSEKEELNNLLQDENVENSIKVCISLLLGYKEQTDRLLALLDDEERTAICNYPIWKFYPKSL